MAGFSRPLLRFRTVVRTRRDPRGRAASDDLALAHVPQTWLATTADPEALSNGRYWHHWSTEKPHPAAESVILPRSGRCLEC